MSSVVCSPEVSLSVPAGASRARLLAPCCEAKTSATLLPPAGTPDESACTKHCDAISDSILKASCIERCAPDLEDLLSEQAESTNL